MKNLIDSINKDFEMVRGDTLTFGIDIEGLRRDLTTAYMTVRKQKTSSIIFQKSLDNGITKVATGRYRCRVAPDDTKTLTPDVYYYDIQIGVDNDIKTILMGRIIILQDITY